VSRAERRELEHASELTEKGRLDEAIARYEVLVASADAEIHDLALNGLADAYAAAGRNAEAESMLRRSIDERGPSNEGVGTQLSVLATVVRRQSRNDEAEELYLRALEAQQPDGPEIKVITMRNLAYLYWSTGETEKARETLARVPGCDEDFLHFLAGVMRAYIEPEIPL
jgi:tetratricopeptide (TPR) repeat protein